ncbi:hypothetical protein O1M63_30905 [Streptomyces mirabilis]|nr:hypothetical protein [Streptomyces mirabilis]
MFTMSGGSLPDFIYWHERDLATEVDRCFLCGCSLTSTTRSDEHVFPQWLLDRYGIRKNKMQLLNGSNITYDRMLIPCCRKCNNEHLSKIESEVSSAFSKGLSGVESLSRDTLFVWVGKIYYGVLFRELTLRSDLRDPNSLPIMDSEFMRLYATHHLLLQYARGVVNWREGYCPASFLFFRCQESSNRRLNFDYFDIANLPFVAIRVGEVGIVCCLQDWGQLAAYEDDPILSRADSAKLHPQQFREVAARSAYAVSRIGTEVPHVPVYGPTAVTIMDPMLAGFYENLDLAEHDPESYAGLLSHALRQPIEDLYDGSSTVSLLDDGEGQIQQLPWSVDEWVRVSL